MKKSLMMILGTSLAVNLSGTALASSHSHQPFQAKSITTLAQNSSHSKAKNGKCGSGKCSSQKKKNGKCGSGKCSSQKSKKKDGKCGSGKCGSNR